MTRREKAGIVMLWVLCVFGIGPLFWVLSRWMNYWLPLR